MRVLERSRTMTNYILAEKEGFEPSIRDKPDTPLAGERLQPLGHFSFSIYLLFKLLKNSRKFERGEEYMQIRFR